MIGNPPYVRMEYLKAAKPYLARHYAVAAERADLYAYFFEKGVRLLKDGGRLGFISSSSFFRTGAGESLRRFLAENATIESVVDFGDLRVFDGVVTYPAIVTLKKSAERGDVSFLLLKDRAPQDLETEFAENARPMPQARLGASSWRFEEEALARLRAKIAQGRKTLRELYGSPLWGIKTGLNDAFVIDGATRDALVAADPRSAEILKPYMRGASIGRWRRASEDWLVDAPKGAFDIADYPAMEAWLTPLRSRLEAARRDKNWFELQQAQLAYRAALRRAEDRLSGYFARAEIRARRQRRAHRRHLLLPALRRSRAARLSQFAALLVRAAFGVQSAARRQMAAAAEDAIFGAAAAARSRSAGHGTARRAGARQWRRRPPSRRNLGRGGSRAPFGRNRHAGAGDRRDRL